MCFSEGKRPLYKIPECDRKIDFIKNHVGKSSKRAGVSLKTLQNTRQSGRDKENGVAGS